MLIELMKGWNERIWQKGRILTASVLNQVDFLMSTQISSLKIGAMLPNKLEDSDQIG